jgi:transposase
MTEEVQRVEVITSVQGRRRWSVAEKIRFVEETLQPAMWVSFVAAGTASRGASRFNSGRREAVRVDDEVIAAGRCASSRSGSGTSSASWVARP